MNYIHQIEPSILFEPNNQPEARFYNIDTNTTANVISRFILSLKGNKNICIIGYGETVGKPLEQMLKRYAYNLSIIQRDIDESFREVMIENADVVVIATPPTVEIKDNLSSKIVIDAAGIYKGDCNYYYSARDIGKATVERIVAEAKKKLNEQYL